MTTALLDAPAEAGVHAADLREIPLAELYESPLNPRKHFDAAGLAELAESLKGGQLNPVLVRPRPKPQGGYELAAGHRRRRAGAKAGLTHLLAIVRPMTDEEFLKILVVENGQRADLTAIEEAEGFKALMGLPGYDVTVIAGLVGKSKEYVYSRLKLLQLIPEAKKLLLDGTITPGHGILLARLSKDDQKRALVPDDTYRGGGVLESERIDDSYLLFREPEAVEGKGTLGRVLSEEGEHEPVKARSVRELQQWIDRNVRFVPEKVDQADLAFDLPQTADVLDAAAANKVKVLKITREYRVPDQARHEKERTYGSQSWKRADGEPEPDPYGRSKPTPSKTCHHSVVGLVVAGPGRGEAFLVCVNKDKCSVHWSEEMKARAKRAKECEREGATNGKEDSRSPTAKKVDPNVLPDELRRQWVQEELTARLPGIVEAVKAVIKELKISDEICWNLLSADLYLDTWNKVGKRGYQHGGGTRHDEVLEPLVAAQLPGRFGSSRIRMRSEDGPGARSELAWLIWIARDCGGLDESIEKVVAARWTAQRKAAAKQSTSAQTSAKPKRLAGDVRREKKAKAKKAAR